MTAQCARAYGYIAVTVATFDVGMVLPSAEDLLSERRTGTGKKRCNSVNAAPLGAANSPGEVCRSSFHDCFRFTTFPSGQGPPVAVFPRYAQHPSGLALARRLPGEGCQ